MAALDNALHTSPPSFIQAIKAMASKLNRGGLFIASIRDYDLLIEQRPAMQEPAFFGSEGTRRIVHQVWDWIEPEKYNLHLYITIKADQDWKTHHFISAYRCLKRQDLRMSCNSAVFPNPSG